jgi:hypothetical protein
MNGAKRNEYRLPMGNPAGKSTLGRRRYRWVNDIKMALSEIELG